MTLPTLLTWVDFDDDGNDTGATVIGANGAAIAVVMDTPYQDDFLQLIAAAPDLLHALELARDHLEVSNHEGEEDETLALINSAIAKAKGQ